jgi:hypothetical protein
MPVEISLDLILEIHSQVTLLVAKPNQALRQKPVVVNNHKPVKCYLPPDWAELSR